MTTEKFHYKTPAGDEIIIPKFKHLSAGLIRSVRRSSAEDQIFTALEDVADEDTLAFVDAMTQEQMNDFVLAWREDSGVGVGESKRSSGSSRSTEKPSSTTS